MPNYCDNYVKIKGNVYEMDRFLEECTSMNVGYKSNKTGEYSINKFLDFEKILPTPKKEDGEDIDNWYEWRLQNWGTKWNSCETFSFNLRATDDSKIELATAFDTAWTPPYKLYKYLFEKYKDTDLEFYAEYYEGGCAFAGEITAKNNEILDEKYYEYKSKKEVDNTENNIKYYAYLIEKDHESIEWMSDNLYEEMEYDEIEEEIIEDTVAEFERCYRKNKFEEAAKIFLNKAINS